MKAPPSEPKIEKAILGYILKNNDSLIQICEHLTVNSFYDYSHKELFKVFNAFFSERKSIDIMTLSEYFCRPENQKVITDPLILIAELGDVIIPQSTLSDYVAIIKEKEIARDLILYTKKIESYVYSDTDMALGIAQDKLQDIQAKLTGSKTKDWKQILDETTEDLKVRNDKFQKGITTGVTTGLKSLDKFLTGWQNSDLILFGGRPAMGKTSMALHFLKSALNLGKRVKFFSLEMSRQQLAHKLIGSDGVNPKKMRTGDLNQYDWEKIDNFISERGDWDLLINDEAGININNLEVDCLKDHMQKPLDLVIIDYLQLITIIEGNSLNEKVGEISKRLKRLAKRLDVPILALSQLSRDNAKNGRPPSLTDLRDSGSLEQDADSVLFIHRPYYYNQQDESQKGRGDIVIAKNRHGESDTLVGFKHNEYFTKFEDEMISEVANVEIIPSNFIPYDDAISTPF